MEGIKVFIVLILTVLLLGYRGNKNLFTEDIMVKRDTKYSDGVEIHRVKYLSDGLEIGGYLVKPQKIDGKLPIIVYNRGGNRNFSLLEGYLNHLEYLASNGYIVVAS